MQIYAFLQRFQCTSYMALCSNCCISETATSICIVWYTFGKLIKRSNWRQVFSRKGAMSTRRARPTAIAVPLVYYTVNDGISFTPVSMVFFVRRKLTVLPQCTTKRANCSTCWTSRWHVTDLVWRELVYHVTLCHWPFRCQWRRDGGTAWWCHRKTEAAPRHWNLRTYNTHMNYMINKKN